MTTPLAQHLAYDSHSTVFDPRPIRSQVPHSCLGPALFMSQLSLWPSCSTLAQRRRKPVCVACSCSHRGPNHADPCLWTTSTGPPPPSPSEPTPADLPFRSLDWLQPSLLSLESPTARVINVLIPSPYSHGRFSPSSCTTQNTMVLRFSAII